MKKIAIRKLNRTQLKKEATKEVYLTGKILLDFFGYSDISELATSRRDAKAKKCFYNKNDYFSQSSPSSILLNVTKENNEVRLTGFSEHLPSDVKETDYIVLEAFEDKSGEVVYLFDVVKDNKLFVLQKYTASDDVDCYEIGKNAKGVVQFKLNETSSPKHENAYWFWDDNVDKDVFDTVINKSIQATLVFKGKIEKKQIRICSTGINYKKLLRAISNSNNAIETQTKQLYVFEEEKANGWMPLKIDASTLLEMSWEDNQVTISDRNQNSFAYFCGGKNI